MVTDETHPPQADRWLDRHFRWRGTEVSRIEAFADAVFAIVLALLFLQQVPKNFGELNAAMKGMIPFAITFVLLAMVWVEHHRFFRRYGLRDKTTFYGNLFLLFLVLVYAFPLKFLFTSLCVMWLGPIGELTEASIRQGMVGGDPQRMMVFYGAGFGLVFATLFWLYRHAMARSDELQLDEIERHATRTSQLQCLVYVAFAALSILLALLLDSSALSGFVYFGIGPVMAALGFVRGVRHERLVAARAGAARGPLKAGS